jgi:hypothetical protein
LKFESTKVRAKEQDEQITHEVNLIRADMAQNNSVARIYPQDIIVVAEEWFKNRRKKIRGFKVFKF